MQCPQCGQPGKKPVSETRRQDDGRILRRRTCLACDQSFLTEERVSAAGLRVRKSDGSVVVFSRTSIRRNIQKAAVRTLPAERLDYLTDVVIADIVAGAHSGPIPTSAIGASVLGVLRQQDPATHIRFALVYAGRQDRADQRTGWVGVTEVRRWLADEYPQLRAYRPPSGVSKVVKRDGRRHDFERAKLERSIGIASKGRGSKDQVRLLATEVAKDVEDELGDQPIVTTGQIASEILRSLRRRDHVAYLRFASTAKGFAAPEDYEAEAVALWHLGSKPSQVA